MTGRREGMMSNGCETLHGDLFVTLKYGITVWDIGTYAAHIGFNDE